MILQNPRFKLMDKILNSEILKIKSLTKNQILNLLVKIKVLENKRL